MGGQRRCNWRCQGWWYHPGVKCKHEGKGWCGRRQSGWMRHNAWRSCVAHGYFTTHQGNVTHHTLADFDQGGVRLPMPCPYVMHLLRLLHCGAENRRPILPVARLATGIRFQQLQEKLVFLWHSQFLGALSNTSISGSCSCTPDMSDLSASSFLLSWLAYVPSCMPE